MGLSLPSDYSVSPVPFWTEFHLCCGLCRNTSRCLRTETPQKRSFCSEQELSSPGRKVQQESQGNISQCPSGAGAVHGHTRVCISPPQAPEAWRQRRKREKERGGEERREKEGESRGGRKEGRKEGEKAGKKRNPGRQEERETETIDLCTPRANPGSVEAPSANTTPGDRASETLSEGKPATQCGRRPPARGGGRGAGGRRSGSGPPAAPRGLPPSGLQGGPRPSSGGPVRDWGGPAASPTAARGCQEGAGGACRATRAQGGGWAFSGRGNQTLIGG